MVITGEGFNLRQFRLSDIRSLVKHANNKKISDNLRDRFPHPYTEKDAEWFINHSLSTKRFQEILLLNSTMKQPDPSVSLPMKMYTG
jgi:hypothetical protein